MERLVCTLVLILGVVSSASAIDLCKAFYPPDSQCVPSADCNVGADYTIHEGFCRDEDTVCCEPPKDITGDDQPFPPRPPTDADSCGVKGGSRTKRAIGGVVNPACTWPWLVSVTAKNAELSLATSHVITGVLISTTSVLVHQKTFQSIIRALTIPADGGDIVPTVTAVMGEYYLNMQGDEHDTQAIDITTATEAGSDFLILKLTTPVEIWECVRPVCIADVEVQLDKCMLAGWGEIATGNGTVTFAHVPLSVRAVVDDPSVCKRFADFATLEYTATTICLELPESKMTTDSDIGSPIMCPDATGLWHLKGLLTTGNYNPKSAAPLVGPFGVDIKDSRSEILKQISS